MANYPQDEEYEVYDVKSYIESVIFEVHTQENHAADSNYSRTYPANLFFHILCLNYLLLELFVILYLYSPQHDIIMAFLLLKVFSAIQKAYQ